MSDSPVLEINNLNKCYVKGKTVLRDFCLTVTPGQIVGILGPNGCGKTTLFRLICGLLLPTSGEIRICGQPRSDASNGLISYLPDRPAFSMGLTAVDILDYYAEFFPDFDRKMAEEMLDDLSIDQTEKMKFLSKGTRDKIQLVLTMARRSRLYVLDEPMAGIDPASRQYIISSIIGNYNPEAAVLISTHLIADIEPALDSFLFMGFGGKILLSGTPDEVRETKGMSLDSAFREVFRC